MYTGNDIADGKKQCQMEGGKTLEKVGELESPSFNLNMQLPMTLQNVNELILADNSSISETQVEWI